MTLSKSAQNGLTLGDAAKKLGIPKRMVRHFISRPDRKALLGRRYRTTKNGLTTIEIIPPELFEALEKSVRSAYGSANGQNGGQSSEEDAPKNENEDASGVESRGDAPKPDEPIEEMRSAREETSENIDSNESDGEKPEDASGKGDSIVTIEAKVGSVIEAASGGGSPETLMIVATYERLLAEKEARLIDLRASLEAERENSKRLSDALAKEQEIRAVEQRKSSEPAPAPKPRWMFWKRS